MTRIKRGSVARKRRHKILKFTKGHRGSSSVIFRMANQQKMKALRFSYCHRRFRKRSLRRLWITRINSVVRHYGLNYNDFMYRLKKQNVHINRKWLCQLAIHEPSVFQSLIKLSLVSGY